MIEPHHKRISGMHVSKNGDIAIVWMAVDPDSKHIHIYDACLFQTEVPAVIADSITNRGAWIPVAWNHETMKDSFQDKGCRMLPDPSDDSDEMAEIVSREIWERLRGGRMTVDKRLKRWAEEAKSIERDKGKIPRDSHPLISATRIAIQQIRSAKRLQNKRRQHKPTRRVALI